MPHLALDLSKSSTGWAMWQPGWDAPRFGTWKLGSEFTSTGKTFVNVHRKLNELLQVAGEFETVTYEEPLLLGPSAGHTSKEIQILLIGLMTHVESYCAAKRIGRCQGVDNGAWRATFLEGVKVPKGLKRGERSKTLKSLCIERCRQFGWNPSNDNEADALGILEYWLHLLQIDRPWRDRALFGGKLHA